MKSPSPLPDDEGSLRRLLPTQPSQTMPNANQTQPSGSQRQVSANRTQVSNPTHRMKNTSKKSKSKNVNSSRESVQAKVAGLPIIKGYINEVPLLHFPPCETDDDAGFFESELLQTCVGLPAFLRLPTPWELSKHAADFVGEAVFVLVESLPDGHRRKYIHAAAVDIACLTGECPCSLDEDEIPTTNRMLAALGQNEANAIGGN